MKIFEFFKKFNLISFFRNKFYKNDQKLLSDSTKSNKSNDVLPSNVLKSDSLSEQGEQEKHFGPIYETISNEEHKLIANNPYYVFIDSSYIEKPVFTGHINLKSKISPFEVYRKQDKDIATLLTENTYIDIHKNSKGFVYTDIELGNSTTVLFNVFDANNAVKLFKEKNTKNEHIEFLEKTFNDNTDFVIKHQFISENTNNSKINTYYSIKKSYLSKDDYLQGSNPHTIAISSFNKEMGSTDVQLFTLSEDGISYNVNSKEGINTTNPNSISLEDITNIIKQYKMPITLSNKIDTVLRNGFSLPLDILNIWNNLCSIKNNSSQKDKEL